MKILHRLRMALARKRENKIDWIIKDKSGGFVAVAKPTMNGRFGLYNKYNEKITAVDSSMSLTDIINLVQSKKE